MPTDEDAAYEVCLRTGYNGGDAGHLHEDPRALGHIYVGPYVRFAADLAYVLEDGRGVCGYVLGAMDSRSFYEAYLEQWLPELRRGHPPPTGDPAGWTPSQKLYHEYHHPDVYWPEPYEHYPSHLHIDLLARAQGQGQGRRLMEVELRAMAERGSPGVHLGMGIGNTRAERFYRALGFTELTRRRDALYLGLRLHRDPWLDS